MCAAFGQRFLSIFVEYSDEEQRSTVIRFVSTSGKFGICTVVGLNGTLVEGKMRIF
jgi:hypothetical protein